MHDDTRVDRFCIDSESKAAWAVDKVLSFDERIARIKAQSAEMIRQIEGEQRRFSDFVTPHLQAWIEAHPPAKGRSVKLISGTIGYRFKPGGPRVVDKEALLVWAKDRLPAAVEVKTTESVPADAVKAHVASTGEIPDGVELVGDTDTFYIKGQKS